MMAFFSLPWALYTVGRGADAASLMADTGLIWATADARAEEHTPTEPMMRPFSSEPDDFHRFCTEDLAWSIKLQYVLCTTWREVPPADVIAALPSPDVLDSYMTQVCTASGRNERLRLGFTNLLLQAAEVCEKLDRHADALLYLTMALRVKANDPTTDMRPTTQALGLSVKGRVLAALGKQDEAEAAFEQAVDVSHRTGLRLFEMFALRDLKKYILDADGRAEEGVRRLKAVLSEMKGPPAELTKLLGSGLNAEAILRS